MTDARRATRGRERAVLVHLYLPDHDPDALDELALLADSAGAEVVGIVTGRRAAPDAATFLGRGKVEELVQLIAERQADLVLVNHAISPVQERNLERALHCRVLDRTGLILDIFAQRASSHEGKLQVELAQLRHMATRLVRGWTHLERQKGGIGLRGPGETQLETDRRLIALRIHNLKKRLHKVHAQRRLRRRARAKVPVPTVSLVGYTNAGKSSLFNRLTAAGVYAADQLFATLDPTMRRLALPSNGGIILADTVGFIRHLPHGLVEAFRSTLEEVSEAALLLHVVDAANPEHHEQMQQVDAVLAEIGAAAVPRLIVFNKIDVTGQAPHCERDAGGHIAKVWLSAHTGAGVDLLFTALSEFFRGARVLRRLRLPPAAGRLRARLYQRLGVLRERVTASGEWVIDAELDAADVAWLERQEDFQPAILEPVPRTFLARMGAAT